jgi:transposase InsO family protein
MPWEKTEPMDQRILFVGAAKQKRTSFTSLCRTFGIAPKTGYKWLRRFDHDGVDGLKDLSKRPHGNSRAVGTDVAERLVKLRKQTGWGPRKLVAWLSDNEPIWNVPAASTVGELLDRHGLIHRPVEQRRPRIPTVSAPLSHATAPNVVWAMDFKGWFLVGDGRRCDPLTITDAYSRYLLRCDAHEEQWSEPVWRSLVRTFREYGLPSAMRVDNGQPWVAPKGALGITTLWVKLTKLGIKVERIDRGKPQQNGRHERFHRTLKEATAQPPSCSLRAQQLRFDDFRELYNFERPHEAHGEKPPARFYKASLRKLPKHPPKPHYPSSYLVVRIPGKRSGRMKLKGTTFFLSTALTGEDVGVLEVEEGVFEVYFADALLGRLHLKHPELGVIAAC